MDKITDKIAALPPEANYISLEFFPPKTAMGFANLRSRLERMARALKPTFVNVTWGAGGSTAQKSLELAEICQRELGLTTCLHLTCTNMSKRLIDKALEDAKVLGIRNILALRGDPPRRAEYRDDDEEEDMDGGDEFNLAVDLVRYIRKTHGDYFCIGVAGYPEGHADESHPAGQSMERDLPFLVEKIQAGADFIMTQLFFDVKAYDKFETMLREHASGVFKDITIIPGLMPIQNFQMIKRTTKLSHARIPDELLDRLEDVKQDDEKVKEVGVDILSELVEQVREIKSRTPGPQGFHFYTLNLEKAVSFVLERTNLIPPDAPENQTLMDDELVAAVPNIAVSGTVNGSGSSHSIPTPQHLLSAGDHLSRRSSNNFPESRNRVIVSSERTTSNPEYETTQLEASRSHQPVQSRANTLAISEGEGVMGREATWDDFPNGRWGDARSPAYGEIDGYGVSLHMSITQARALWGEPKTPEEINKLFIDHLRGDLRAIPWSEEEFNPETDLIKDQLIALNKRGWWTVASQPAVNGLRSDDAIFGWGPANGFIFQKAFVEFFIPKDDWKRLHEKLSRPEMHDIAWFYAVNAKGDFLSTDVSGGFDEEGTEAGVNAVTWGVFPQKEIITPTIIEEVSFRAWGEEAFNIWGEWSQVYGKHSVSEKLLGKLKGELWLVNIIHHDYLERDALWELLMSV
ncbi:unnamed protein product [Discula destructiva]